MHHFVRLAGVGRCVVVAECIDVELATKDAFVELHGLAGIVPEVQVRVELGRHDPPCIRAAIQESCTTRPYILTMPFGGRPSSSPKPDMVHAFGQPSHQLSRIRRPRTGRRESSPAYGA